MTGLIGWWPLNEPARDEFPRFDGFEDNDLSEWDVNDMTTTDTRAYSGTYAAKCNTANGSTYQARRQIVPGGTQLEKFEFYWQETTNAYGAGIRLRNSNGNFELGLADNNPQWDIEDGNGFENVYGGDGYDRWIRYTVTFDWENETFAVDFEDLSSGATYTDSGRPLINGRDIEYIEIWDYNNQTWAHGGAIDHWFDDISWVAPAKTFDKTENANHGRAYNQVTQGVAGRAGLTGYAFDGEDDHVDVSEVGNFATGDQPFTMSVWCRSFTQSSNEMAFSWGIDNDNRAEIYFGDGTNIKTWMERQAEAGGIGTEANPVGQWVHVALTYQDGVAAMYVNGELVGTRAFSNTMTTGTSTTMIGDQAIGSKPRNPLNGEVCDARVYNRALSASEIQSIYEQTSMAAQPTDGVSQYKLNGDATDNWGSNDGTVHGATFVDGKFGQAASFDGTDDYIEVGDSADLRPAEFSISAWVKAATPSGWCVIAGKDYWDNNEGWVLYYDEETGPNMLRFNGPAFAQASVEFDKWENEWVHVTGTYDGDTVKLYVDGQKVDETTGETISHATTPFNIGCRNQNGGTGQKDFFPGEIDNVAFYPRALKDWEVKAIRNGWYDIVHPPEDGVSYYPMDGDATDHWGTNDGTVNGATVTDESIRGRAYSFSGSDGIAISHDTSLDLTTPFTLSAWVQPETVGDNSTHAIFRKDSAYTFYFHEGNLDFYNWADGTRLSVTNPPTEGWNLVTAVWDGTYKRIYVNGIERARQSSTDFQTSTNDLGIGYRPAGSMYFEGEIDDARIYDRALSPAEIYQLYLWGTRGRDIRHYTVSK